MEDKTMRKMMMAMVFTAACGSVMTPPNGHNGSGSNTGSDMGSDMGSGSGSSGPTTCNAAADCAAGMACDVAQHMCVTAAFTIDKTGFIDDGTRWWTNKSNPTLHGTIDNPSGETLTILINNQTVGTATITGTTWSFDLPTGSILEAGTPIVFRLSSGVEQSQTFALDDKAPVAVMFGSIIDERGDTIDFSTGEAVHTHAGATIALDGTGCPSVYKYAYLMDATKPLYGSETSPNPFTWQVKASDATPIDSMDSAYRVRDASGAVLYNWTSMQPDASGVFAITLHRNDIAPLGTKTGHMFVDVRFRDSFGNESTTSACWDNHPMAPPLEVDPIVQQDLFTWSLAAGSPISPLMSFTTGARVYSRDIVQYSNEAMTVHFVGGRMAVNYSRASVDDMVPDPDPSVATTLTCASATDPSCAIPADPADRTDSGVLGNSAFWFAKVVAASNGAVIDGGNSSDITFTIPGRPNGSAPQRYRIDINLGVLDTLNPANNPGQGYSTVSEYQYLLQWFTGYAPGTAFTACTAAPRCRVINGNTYCSCAASSYREIRAIDQVTLDFAAANESLSTSASGSAAEEPVGSYATAALAMPAMHWDSGNADLPGPH